MSRALAEDVVNGQAFSLQEVDFKAIDTPEKMIRTFIGFEDDTITFYEILKTLISEPGTASQLEQIIAEEKKHMATFREMLSANHAATT
jgi:rubrerythrin